MLNDDDRDRLRRIRTFPSLIRYLRDELDWPIETDDFEDLTFDYEPDELGIDAKTAAKIQEIKQLRPLAAGQPWGIFFVKFEPKRLPVVALRRILSRLVFRKRQTANPAERQSWDKHDLLFISSFGEGEDRQLSFAHFTDNDAHGDLPTLRVLGWDQQDTSLKLDHVHGTLHEKLRWPEDDTAVDDWRSRWAGAFTLRPREVITTSRLLAKRLAELARDIRKRVNAALAVESEKGPLTTLMTAFKQALLHDLDEDGFADMYAQTIAYGLLSARISRPGGLVADNIADMVPITNPFLKELMETFLNVGGRRWSDKQGRMTGIDFDELGVNEVVDLLRDTQMEDVLRDFDNRNPQEDPVIHFYELFLKEYDAKKRMQRGVFYTPKPVVSYIVRSVHELLQIEFGLEDGLADTTTWGEMVDRHEDLKLPEIEVLEAETHERKKQPVDPATPFVQILDPATGTATFLVEVIDVIYRTMRAKWEAEGHGDLWINQKWNEYVPQHLLPRLHGYELLMAPYAIAHMKIGLKLFETGYTFDSGERARIYLTNALEPPHDFSDTFEQIAPALAHESEAVNNVKRYRRFTVVVGNPPYSSSITEPQWLMELLAEWKQGLKETKSDLNREEWKFLRFAQHQVHTSGEGLIGFIVNRDFIDGITKRRLREHLGAAFPNRTVVDLNGDVKGNIADENVFEIEQGVAITVLRSSTRGQGHRYTSLVGSRSSKYEALVNTATIDSKLHSFKPAPPYFRWLPLPPGQDDQESEYAAWWPINECFASYSSGIQTKNDPICIGWTRDEVLARTKRLSQLSLKAASEEFGISPSGAWSLKAAQDELRRTGVSARNVYPILYRPLDYRFIYYTAKSNGFLGRPRYGVMKHVLGVQNIGLIFNRQIVGAGVSHFGVSRVPICHGTFYLGNKGQDYFAPLRVKPEDLLANGKNALDSNLTDRFFAAMTNALSAKPSTLSPEDALAYIFAVVHSPIYRTRYADFIKMDFARLPLTGQHSLFNALVGYGHQLIELHLLESPTLAESVTKYTGTANPEVEKVSYADQMVWLDKAQTRGFKGVPEEVWNFHIGGYQVCEKWLKDRQAKGGKNPRPGRKLTADDIAHYQKILKAISETIRIMGEIDAVIEEHGGWPDAFITDPEVLEDIKSDASESPAPPDSSAAPRAGGGAATFTLRSPTTQPSLDWDKPDGTEPTASATTAVAEDEEEAEEEEEEDAPRLGINDISRHEVLAAIRDIYRNDPEPCDRETLLGRLRQHLGFGALGKNIREALSGDIRAAVRRGVLERRDGLYHHHCRQIGHYRKPFLRQMFLASLADQRNPRVWIEQDEAIRNAARYLGFNRTGAKIQQAFKNAIRALIRAGDLERDGSMIRRTA